MLHWQGSWYRLWIVGQVPVMKEMIPIPSSSRDVTMHLKSVKVSSSSVVSEGELILLRAGIFDDDGKGMTVERE